MMRFRHILWGTNGLWLACSLLWSGGAVAEQPRTYPESGVQGFLGLDDTSAPTQVQDGRAQDLQNVVLDISHGLRQRDGISLIGGTLDVGSQAFCAVTGLYYTKFSSSTERIIATCGTRTYYLSAGTTWTQITPGAVFFTEGQNNQFVFTTALDKIIATNGVTAPWQWGGVASEALANVTFNGLTNAVQKGKTVAFFKNYLVFGNTTEAGTSYPTRIRWSNVGTINTWSDEDYVDIGALGGQEVVAFAELYDNLYVFLTDSIYKVSLVGGADTFQISKVTDDIGCIAKNSVQSITLTNSQNGLIFLDKDKKIYFFNGVIAQDISQFITTVMAGLSGSRLQYAVSADTNTDYLLCVTSGTGSSNNLCLDLQYQLGEWTKHQNVQANAMAHVLDANTTDQVYYGSDYSFVYQFADADNRDDVGTATGTIDAVGTYATSTSSSLQILYDTGLNLTNGVLAGAPIELIGGTGATQTNTLVTNTSTGLVVVTPFSTTPSTNTTYEVGAIDSYYTTKWYDFGNAATLKHFGEVYLWGDADVSSTHTLSYANDYSSDVDSLSLSMSASSTDAIWGSAIWGVALWGDTDTIFRQAKLESQGRYLRLKFTEDDPNETFHWYGWVNVFWDGDVN